MAQPRAEDLEILETEAALAADAAERERRALQGEVRRLQSELDAVRSVLRTTCRICLPYYVPEQ